MGCSLWSVDTQFGGCEVQIIPSGNIIFAQILDQEAVIINSQHVAEDLMDKRSRIYSDRPYLATRVPCVFPRLLSTLLKCR